MDAAEAWTKTEERAARMNITDRSWVTFSEAFRDAFSLMQQQGDKRQILDELERARDGLDAVMDDLPPIGANSEADMTRRLALSMRANVEAIEREISTARQ
jgi:hypothetical protein